MDQMLDGIIGATAIMDNILIAGRDRDHHDSILKQVMERATSYNLKLNMQKCKVRQKEVQYVGHLLTADGLKPDPSRIEALHKMPISQNKEDVWRFLGFFAYLAKFIPQLSEVNAPLRALLRADGIFDWQPAQGQAFHKLLDLCCQQPVLRYDDVKAPVEIHVNAIQSGLGGVLM